MVIFIYFIHYYIVFQKVENNGDFFFKYVKIKCKCYNFYSNMVTKNCTVVIKLTVENNGDFYFKIKCKCYNFYCNNVKKKFFFPFKCFYN